MPLFEALLDSGQKIVWNRPAHDRIDPQKIVDRVVMEVAHRVEALLGGELFDVRAGGHGKQPDVDLAKLAAAAGLLLVSVASFGGGLDRFAIGNFGLFGVDFDLVAAFEPLADDLQVQFAHAGHDQLFGLRIAIEAERADLLRRILCNAPESLRLVAAALGRNGQADHRRRELDRRHGQIAQRGAGVQFFELGHGHDLARPGLVGRAVFRPLALPAIG